MSDESEAIKAEATESDPGRPFTFEGDEYRVLPGQPSLKAIEHLADLTQEGTMDFQVLAIREIIGRQQWDAFCAKHDKDRLGDFWTSLHEVYSGN